ncbi:probable oligoribonuclease [Ceratitis capitata]|uniref:Probable oligoribonuclease n=1 Tax=Ceratitis capitata TaxID=7213 RepID=A0A811U994_CERCA|nr:probable oligoribonuclease [Ceratitis capitata]CAD6994527.1 unnamed protein product [Ceratitis capitata]
MHKVLKFISSEVSSKVISSTRRTYSCNQYSSANIIEMGSTSKLLGSENSIVWMDLEMTGLNSITDKIIEVACLITDKDLNVLTEGLNFAIKHPPRVFEEMNEWCIKQHNKSGLVQRCLESDITSDRAEPLILEYLQRHIPKGKCPLGGNSIYMDRLFLRQQMPSVDEYLHYRIVDISSIKELCSRWRPDILKSAPKKRFLHRSLEDLEDSIEELIYYREHFFKTN